MDLDTHDPYPLIPSLSHSIYGLQCVDVTSSRPYTCPRFRPGGVSHRVSEMSDCPSVAPDSESLFRVETGGWSTPEPVG